MTQNNPYAAPVTESERTSLPTNDNYNYHNLASLTTAVTVLTAILLLCSIAISTIETIGFALYPTFLSPTAPPQSVAEESLFGIYMLFAFTPLLFFIPNVIAVCRFMSKANGNVHSFGAKALVYTPGWCVGYWFIPILNLFRPYQAMKEIYQASIKPDRWSRVAVGSVLPVWWACWIIGEMVSRVETRLATRGIDVGGETALLISWSSTILHVIAGICLIMIVRQIHANQLRIVSPPRSKQAEAPFASDFR